MVFMNDQSIKIRTRVRSAFGRLRPSKSSLGLASLAKIEWAPPTPLPVLDLPKDLSSSFDDFMDQKSTAPVLLKRSNKKVSKRPAPRLKVPNDLSKLPVLDQMLLQQGLLNSPISIHLTTLLAESAHSPLSSSRGTRRRSSSASVYSTSQLCLPSAGPFTPELVINHLGNSNPELSATFLTVAEPQSCIPMVDSPQPSASGSSPNPSLRAVKLSASPAHRCLKRRGLIPSSQPISSHLLQSVMSTSTSDLGHLPEIQKTPVFKLEAALSAEICVWTDEPDNQSTLRPHKIVARQRVTLLDKDLLLPLPSYGRRV
ncbi:hypothetical protein VP01_390g10 [Puccinia sorghi]|uniref:Uncharacterized protein n=1 Tax=Puccinia sorghi TaxID=27349 RepID=A0A0L6USM8_9BASI|nr:hypothetical protein VP01_390g10 [Puccinia sorghi]